jgi:hypothetical protein
LEDIIGQDRVMLEVESSTELMVGGSICGGIVAAIIVIEELAGE